MAFTYNPETNIGKCRLLVWDTESGSSGTSIFSDASIESILDLNNDSVWLASADLCRSLASRAIPSAFDLEIGNGAIEIDKRKIAAYWIGLAEKYELRASSSADQTVEYTDSYDLTIDRIGIDRSEYVGDI